MLNNDKMFRLSDIDECDADPCDNDASCTDGIDAYTCTCVPGYTDKNCSTSK